VRTFCRRAGQSWLGTNSSLAWLFVSPVGAIDRNHQGRGHGRILLADALFRAVRSEIASFAVVVDAKDDATRRFYQRESFLPFPDQPLRLFRPMADIAKLYE